MCAQRPAPADAYAPDADRDGPDASKAPPEWIVHLLALIILFVLRQWVALRSRRAPRRPAHKPEQPIQPAEAKPASEPRNRDELEQFVTHMVRHFGRKMRAQGESELLPATATTGDSAEGASPQPSAEAAGVMPGTIHADAVPTSATIKPRPWRPAANLYPLVRKLALAAGASAMLSEVRWQVQARVGTGPPIGPPNPDHACQLSYA